MFKLKLESFIFIIKFFLVCLITSMITFLITSCSSSKFNKFSDIKITAPIKAPNKHAQWILYQKRHQNLIKGNWIFEGVVGVSISGKGQSARVLWERAPEKYEINLFGPLNIGSVNIKYNNGIYEFINDNGDKYQDRNPEKLLNQILGYSLPLLGADYWILGMIDPSYKYNNIKLNEYGSLSNISQAGWDIKYLNYKVYNGIMMPNIIIFYNSDEDLRIKLVIKKWAFK